MTLVEVPHVATLRVYNASVPLVPFSFAHRIPWSALVRAVLIQTESENSRRPSSRLVPTLWRAQSFVPARRNAPPRTPFGSQLGLPAKAPLFPLPELSAMLVPLVSSKAQCKRLVESHSVAATTTV